MDNKLIVNLVTNLILPRWKELGYVPINETDLKDVIELIHSKQMHWNNAGKLIDAIHQDRIKLFGEESYKQAMIQFYGVL